MNRRRRRVKFAYLDTNFYSFLRKSEEARQRAVGFFRRNNFSVMVTLPHWAELHNATRQHEMISEFWDEVGAVIVAPIGRVNYLTLDAYPAPMPRLPDILGPTSAEVVRGFLGGIPVSGSITGYSALSLSQALERVKQHSRGLIEEVRRTVPDALDRVSFEDRWIVQQLASNCATRLHPKFASLELPLSPGSFPSMRVQAALVWWTHVRGRPPNFSGSELGDRMHSEYFYCCDAVVLERHQHEMMRQLRQAAPDLFRPRLATYTTGDFIKMLGGFP